MTMTSKERRDLTLGERLVNWAKALGIILPLLGTGIVSLLGYIKSDNTQGGLDSLIQQLNDRVAKQERVINAQSEKLEKMARRMVFFQAHQDGLNAGRLYEKSEQLQKALAEIKAKKITKVVGQRKLEKILRSRPDPKEPVEKPLPDPSPPEPAEQKDAARIPRIRPKPFNKTQPTEQKKLSF